MQQPTRLMLTWGDTMRIVFGTICLLLAAAPAVASAVPAPLLGLGLPAMAAVGGVLLGSRFLKRK